MKGHRRSLLKALTLGGGALTALKLPTHWSKPVVESVVLPAHAQTTGGPSDTLPNIVSAGGFRTTSPIIGQRGAPDLLDHFVQLAHAVPPSFDISVCIVMNRAQGLYDAFVIVSVGGGDFPSYRGTGLPADPPLESDSDLVYDGDCGSTTSIADKLISPAHANSLGVQIRVFNVSATGANVEVEVEESRWSGFLNWNQFGCGLNCGELGTPPAAT